MSDKNYNRIKIVLAEKNLPNKYLAEKLGRDQATISKFHNLISTISFPFLTDYNYLCHIRATAK